MGFADDLFGNGKTVVRGGFGLLVDQPVSGSRPGTLSTNLSLSTSVSCAVALPSRLATSSTLPPLPAWWISAVNPHYRNGYIESYNLNVQQSVYGFVASLGYYGSLAATCATRPISTRRVGC